MDATKPVTGSSSQDDDEGAPPAKRVRQKFFSECWFDNPEFAGWLQAVPSEPTKAYCTCCQKKINCGKSELRKHAAGRSHNRNRVVAAVGKEVVPANQPHVTDARNTAVKTAETKLAAFFAEHNIATQAVEHFVPLCKDIFSDPQVARNITLDGTTCSRLTTNCPGISDNQKLVESLKSQKFSVLIDENTDISDKKTLCVLVQFVSPETRLVKTELLEIVKLDAADGSADKTYTAFKACLAKKEIPITNVVGMASDNASAITGTHHTFMNHLQKDSPRLITLNCMSHSSGLIASKACLTLPRFCEDLIRRIGSYVSDTAKYNAILCKVKQLLELEKSKILKPSETRWLSMLNCVTGVLQHWNDLKMYFAYASKQDDLKSTEIILGYLCHDVNRAYFLFLKYSLNFFNCFNALFQGKKVLLHKLAENSRSLISQIASNFVRSDLLPALTSGTLNVSHTENLLPLNEVHLGPECDELLLTLPAVDSEPVRQNCLRFYVTAVEEMQKRLPLQSSILDDLRFLDPQIALFLQNRKSLNNLSPIAKRFGDFDLTNLAFEWYSLPSVFTEEKKNVLLTLNVDKFWKEIASKKNILDVQMFPTLEKLVNTVLSLPHSNAEVERIFFTIINGSQS